MIVQLFNRDILKVLTVFSISPGSRFLRKELKERTRLNNVNLDRALNGLMNAGLVRKEKRLLSLDVGKAKEIIKLVSREYEVLKELPLGVYFSVIDIVFSLGRLGDVDAYLFGSYAKLVFREDSDIDLAIISDRIGEGGKKVIEGVVKKVERRYGKKIEIHYFGKTFYKNRRDPLVRGILKDGVRLL